MKIVTQSFQDVPVDWEALEDAFENNAPEVHSYLHVDSGEVLRVVDGIADPEMHSRIVSDNSYLRIEPVSSREQYRWMERFIAMVTEPEVQRRLTNAIDGKGAFRRFKDVLMTFSAERERWFSFRSERLRVFMEAWLNTHGLRAKEREATAPTEEAPEPESEAPIITQEQLGVKKGRGSDSLRKQLAELAETMTGRDLEKVVAFAEFLKARRAARHHSHRADSSHRPEIPESAPAPVGSVSGGAAPLVDAEEALAPTPELRRGPRALDADESDPPSQRRAADRR